MILLDIVDNLHNAFVVVVDVFLILHVAFNDVSTFPLCNDNSISSSIEWFVGLYVGHDNVILNWYVPLKYLLNF